ncbi:MAG TPA: hypothetical protein VGR35_02005 [Tepidisphaeraceae bacterium]|nr:hypothetical protein [Tepidisphaeraceae bacterium]
MRKGMLGWSVVLLLVVCSNTLAAEAPHRPPTESHGTTDAARHDPQPVLPDPSPLPGAMLILIAGLFLAAATVGPAVRYHAPEEVPETSSHDQHAAHGSHGHGH